MTVAILANKMATSPFTNFTSLTPPVAVKIVPIGYWYLQNQILKGQHQTELRDPEPKLEKSSTNVESSNLDLVETDSIDLALLDPTACKSQDHYKLLGLTHLRYKATTDDIKTAYRNKVIKHHPDKSGKGGASVSPDISESSQELSSEEKHFQCIVNAYEVLSNPVKRRAYDSVDPTFDDSIPDADEIAESNFFDEFAPVFQRNSHFSISQPVPQLGDNGTPYGEVDDFYQFWFSFKSWREFSYFDDEDTDPDKAENREERRWLEKQNKQGRTQLKKNETHRVKKLVELAYSTDPRVRKADSELKQRKEEERKARQDKQAREQEEKDRRKREKEEREQREREERAEMERLQDIEEKRQREEKKQALKRQRNEFKTACGHFNNFSISPANSASAELTQNIIDIENLCQALSIDELAVLTDRIRKEEALEAAKGIFEEQVTQMHKKEEEEMQKLLSQSGAAQGKKKENKGSKSEDWSHEEIQLLVKAVNLYPGGTQGRWDVIANYINRHTSSMNKSGKQVISKVKNMQKFDSKDTARSEAQPFASFEKSHVSKMQVSTEKTINYETVVAGTSWTNAEQKSLEEGLRAFPTSDPDRWTKIAEKVGSRNEKECKKRFKEIVESLQAKKTKT